MYMINGSNEYMVVLHLCELILEFLVIIFVYLSYIFIFDFSVLIKSFEEITDGCEIAVMLQEFIWGYIRLKIIRTTVNY